MSTGAFFVGALVVIAALTETFNWLLRHHAESIPRLLMANGLSLFVATVIGGFGFAEGEDLRFTSAFALCVFPQLLWLIVGIVRYNRSVENKVPKVSHRIGDVDPPLPSAPLSEPDPVRAKSHSSLAPREHRFNNFIAKNWRGEFPLWVSYWVFGFLGNIVVGLIALLATAFFSVNTGYEPLAIFAGLIIVWLGVLTVAIWQLVGVWRSASVCIEQRNREGKHALWAGFAKIAVILGFLRLVGEFSGAGMPQIAESSQMAFFGDPSIPSHSIRIMRNGTEVEITGGLKYGLTEDFLRILRASPQIRVVHLDSPGGRVGEAVKLNKAIRDHNLITYVSGQCVSACTLAFAAGRERWLRDGAILGFHAPTFPGMSEADLVEGAQLQKDLFTAAGFDPVFVSRALVTPNKDMWTPSSDELLRARVITGVSDGRHFAVSGFGADVTRDGIIARLTKSLPVLATMKQRLPNDYNTIVGTFYQGYVDGETQTELTAAVRTKLLPVIAAYRPLADDDVLVELGKLISEQYAALALKSPTLCYLYASGAGGARDFSSDMPEALIQRELVLGERVIATASQRPDLNDQVLTALWEKVGLNLRERIGEAKVQLLLEGKLDPSKHGDYCAAAIAFMQEITNLKQNEAATLIRQTLSGK